ncbi:PorT family protein [Sphingobacterium alkalisoli]|uniref:PorT family protein n=1 Tax=Sphingobacterium alkalisoli TaxID=1874115 RepID=A0A4U0H7H9_9SPHI|nr:PorT family protein [Sphingobacterium alkalisoli]TJY67823.1 PorT family protein [Sphingobacterium alkalisoli]GGH11126.1 hypothetical protein GCM10011418_09800 [Sphingobacterium alkalisoli]
MEKKRKNIDELFQEGLQRPLIPFDEMNWQAMEQKLERKRRLRKTRVVSIFVAMTAASIAVFLLLHIDKPAPIRSNVVLGKPEYLADTAVVSKNAKFEDRHRIDEVVKNRGNVGQKEKSQGLDNKIRLIAASEGQYFGRGEIQELTLAYRLSAASLDLKLAPAASPREIKMQITEDTLFVFEEQDQRSISAKQLIKESPFKQKGTLSVLAAPDLSNVRGAGQYSLSQNVGLLYTHSLSKKISISTGILYAKKNYESSYSFYKPKSIAEGIQLPSDVDASCDVIDIPLLVNFNVANLKKTKVTLSAGLSSYFMLRENYRFSYDEQPSYSSSTLYNNYEVRGENKHIMGVADVAISFDRQINDKVNIGIRPFVKLPLTGIGYGRTRLESKGVAIAVGLNIFGR